MTPTEILQAELAKVVGKLQTAEANVEAWTAKLDDQMNEVSTLSTRRTELERAIAKLAE